MGARCRPFPLLPTRDDLGFGSTWRVGPSSGAQECYLTLVDTCASCFTTIQKIKTVTCKHSRTQMQCTCMGLWVQV